MSTAVRPPLTKPRQSQLVLEGAAAVVSSALLLWLLLWFVTKGPQFSRVFAYHVPKFDVPYLAADVRGLAPPGVSGPVDSSIAKELPARLAAVMGAESPPVVFITAPTFSESDDLKPLELIREVARSARRDVLIVLDLAQVDSDRELGVFGNAPYFRLGEELAKVEKKDPDTNIFVMTSCAPGQKSWMVDSLGRSVFAYYLQKGLADGASRGAREGGRSGISVEELYSFVRRNVEGWVQGHRRRAIQTPMLWSVGPGSRSFVIPPVAIRLPGVAAVAVEDGADSTKAADKGTARVDPREKLLASLLAEWKEHEALKGRAREPYRDAPASWRVYQGSLLRAERLVRFSWNDPGLRTEAEQSLQAAVRERGVLAAALDQVDQAEKRFPFQPARGDEKGARVLNASLKYVTDRDLPELVASDRPDLVPAPAPAPKAAPDGAGPGARKVNIEGLEEALSLPPELRDAASGQILPTFLELQLPAWASRFNSTFAFDAFKDGMRGGLLRAAVLKRLDAEAALALDRRGLDWIKATIQEGDEERRQVQDELFAVSDEGSAQLLEDRIVHFGGRYNDAYRRIELYHKARSFFERVAAELPYYGDWAVLEECRIADDSGGPSAFVGLNEIFQKTAGLAATLERWDDPESLAPALDRASIAFKKVEQGYNERVGAILANDREASWRDLDDVLATPLIPRKDRESLLRQVLLITETPESLPTPAAATSRPPSDPPAPLDPGFRRKALGLARLDVELRRLAAGTRKPGAPEDDFSKLVDQLDSLGTSGDPRDVEATLVALKGVNTQIGSFRSKLSHAQRARGNPDEGRAEREVGVELRAADQEGRFRSVRELRLAGDDAAGRLEAFSRRAAMLFHAERLAQDYARGVDELIVRARTAYPGVADAPFPIPRGFLSPDLAPPQVAIDEVRHSASFKLGVKVEEPRSGARGVEKVPKGRAFVGVLVREPGAIRPAKAPDGSPKPEEAQLRVSLEGKTDRTGSVGFVGGLVAVGQEARESLRLRVEQLVNAEVDGTVKRLPVRVFYRGRVEDGGQAVVEVATRDFGQPVTVEIAQDREALRRIYGPVIEKTISDQFTEHPGRGYLHCRGKLDYVLTFRNRTPDPLEIKIERMLVPSNGDGSPRKLASVVRRLEPQAEAHLNDKITSQDVPLDKPQDLIVKVTVAGKGTVQEEKFTFTQLRLEDYLRITPTKELYDDDHNGILVPCFLIRIFRAREDLVTEPIKYSDCKFAVNDQEPTSTVKEGYYLDRVGNPIIVHYKILQRDVEFSWRVKIEEEERSGKYKVK